MSLESVFIPKKIKVGYQKRDGSDGRPGTYTGKLAYVIYFDNKGKIRKEKSWTQWCDPKIPAEEFDNVPTSGFVLNKNVQRSGGHFGSGHSYIRIYDPRGIEFEISIENLTGILMNTTCTKKGFDGEFVYAWIGGDHVLLPTNSEEYQKAVTYTTLQDQKVSAKTLVPGASYKTKKGEDVVYIGRFNWFKWIPFYSSTKLSRIISKSHIFIPAEDLEKKKPGFFPKGDVSFLASCNNPAPVLTYADLVDRFKENPHSSEITSWDRGDALNVAVDVSKLNRWDSAREAVVINHSRYYKNYFSELDENGIVTFSYVEASQEYNSVLNRHVLSGFYIRRVGELNTKTMEYVQNNQERYHYGRDNPGLKLMTQDEMEARIKRVRRVQMVLESGKKVSVYSTDDLKAE